MGNYRFKLSDMIPNAWFYKLKYTSTKPKEEHHHHHKPTKKSSSKHTTTSSSSSSSLQSVPSHNHIITTKQQPHLSEQRKSYYFTRDLTNNLNPNSPTKPAEIKRSLNAETPRKSSSRRRRSTKRNSRHNSPRLVTSSISAGCSCRATFESVWTKMDDPITTTPIHPTNSSSSDCDSVLPEYGSGQDGSPSWSTSCNCSVRNDSSILDDDDDDTKESNTSDASAEPIHQIPPIVTKKKTEPTKILRAPNELVEEKTRRRLSVKVVKEETTTTTWSSSIAAKNSHHKNVITSTSPARGRLSSASSQSGLRLRINSPRMRIQGRKSVSSTTTTRRASVSESFAVVKASRDPKKDFRKSMVEMIVENDIRKSKDLEELLACYLSLNSDEYHDLIINVFKQIWFDFVHLRLK